MNLRIASALAGLAVAAIYAATPHPLWLIVAILAALSAYNLATVIRNRRTHQ